MKKHRFDITYDVRVIGRNIREGLLSKEDFEKYLESLEDASEKGMLFRVDDEANAEEAATEGGKGEGK
ncbi:MAG: hypothetical protein QXX77_05545 [Candidatus Methanosuratincola sp.]|jgi:hypothetical protein